MNIEINKEFHRAIVVPVYNEAGSVKKVIDNILRHIDANTKLILVQDGSNDGAEDILLELERSGFLKNHDIDLVNHHQNQGYGKALLSGFEKSLEYQYAEYILTMDCDEQHQPEDIEKFFSYRDVDVLSGSRYLMEIEKGIAAPPDRVEINKKLTEKYINIAADMFHEEWRLTDSFCGMKRYSRSFLEAFMRVLPQVKYYESCMGYGFPLIVWNFYLRWLKLRKKSLASSFAEIAIPKIYISNDRTFGIHLDFPRKRYRYYLNCMKVSFE
jgi:dolichol-phosphate mannosyltransferase